MKTFKKIGKWILLLIGLIVGVILILLLIIRLNSQGIEEPFLDEYGDVLPKSIVMHEDIMINGVPQRITIRGKNSDNPILLRVHGGPGSAALPIIARLVGFDLEDAFTVCYWEQRGSGVAYNIDIPVSTITLEQIVSDGLGVVDYLKQKFEKDKVYIEGFSWGTSVSAFMVQKHPELFHAYIGIGQMANQSLSEEMSYDFVLAEAQKQNDTISIRRLEQIGRPPYPNKSNLEMADACNTERSIVVKYAKPRMNMNAGVLKEIILDNSMTFGQKLAPLLNTSEEPAFELLWPTCFNINLMRDVPEWEIPIFIMHGEDDHFTETSLAKAYFDSLKAPSKEWFLFEDATHAVQYEYPEKYRLIYLESILKQAEASQY